MSTLRQNLSFCAALLPLLVLTACGGGGAAPASVACQQSNTPFQTAYALAAASPPVPGGSLLDEVSLDAAVHEYRFTPRVNMTVCSVGYQAVPALLAAAPAGAKPYRIELRPLGSATLLYQGDHAFATGSLTHELLPTPITLLAGQAYVLRRTVSNPYGDAVHTIGRLLRDAALPVQTPELTLHSAYAKNPGGPPLDGAFLPFIDFGVQ